MDQFFRGHTPTEDSINHYEHTIRAMQAHPPPRHEADEPSLPGEASYGYQEPPRESGSRRPARGWEPDPEPFDEAF